MTQLELKFYIDIAHFTPCYPKGHPNQRVHGHTYETIVGFVGEINPDTGTLINLEDTQKLISEIKLSIDHKLINEIPGLERGTSEVIAQWIFKKFKPLSPLLSFVSVYRESVGMKATYMENTN